MAAARKTNAEYCKRYRGKNKEEYRIANAERKRHSRLKQKLLHPAAQEEFKKYVKLGKVHSRLLQKVCL